MQKIEYSLSSLEVAEMIRKNHKDLLRDIHRYINQINEANEKYGDESKIAPVDFFTESTYKDAKGETRPCYRLTKKGCEFIAHKLTGQKGTEFTARYINRFHEMENMLSETAKPEITTEQIEKFMGFMEKQQQFMADQEKFNQKIIKKLESSRRIQARQAESDREIFSISGMKGDIIRGVELIQDDRSVKMIYGFVTGLKAKGNVEKKVY